MAGALTWLRSLVAIVMAALVAAAPGSSGTGIVSAHWAGYVVTRNAATPAVFTSATGTWKQPRASCTRDDRDSAAAIWVGIGGYDGSTDVLQQIGSTVGCDAHGKPSSSAWFAVLPYPAHRIPLKVRPGDTLTGAVTILGTGTRLQLADRTEGWVFTRTITAGVPDTTSAEWIVEPPMLCARHACRQAQLANFGILTFSDVGLTADEQDATLATPGLTVSAVELAPVPSRRGATWSTAAPGSVAGIGTSFAVTWQEGRWRNRAERRACLPAVSRPARRMSDDTDRECCVVSAANNDPLRVEPRQRSAWVRAAAVRAAY